MLEIRNLSKNFGGLQAIREVSFACLAGDILGVIGPNGAGKTTLFNLVTGFVPPTSGGVVFNGVEITGRPPHRLVRHGLARTFQGIRLHRESTVWETVWAAQALHLGVLGLLWGPNRRRRQEAALHEEIERILELTQLAEYRDRLAAELPFGLLRKLEIARALATRPRLLLMDEPASGLNPAETRQLVSSIRRIHQGGLTIAIIEHDMSVVMDLSHRIVVLNFGRKIAEGTPDEVRRDPEVIRAYLGQKQARSA